MRQLQAVGEFEAIEPHAEKPDTQIVTFKDRKTAEKFMYGTKNIPNVGTVELAWVNTPLPPVKPTVSVDVDGDATMGNSSTNGESLKRRGGDGHTAAPEVVEVDYDVAEEDDRWMAA